MKSAKAMTFFSPGETKLLLYSSSCFWFLLFLLESTLYVVAPLLSGAWAFSGPETMQKRRLTALFSTSSSKIWKKIVSRELNNISVSDLFKI